MGQGTKIEWADDTFNPWLGCTKVARGCEHCYAERDMDKRWGKVAWGPRGTRVRTSEAYWRQPVRWNAEAEAAGVPRRVFCASLADVFEGPETCPEGYYPVIERAREDLFELIDRTPWLVWMLLTKRPANAWTMWPDARPRANVWLGYSIAEQGDVAGFSALRMTDHVVPVRFVSVEPMRGPVDLAGWLDLEWNEQTRMWGQAFPPRVFGLPIGWVICGGESGPNAAPMHPDWVRRLRDQANAAGVPFFFKQWGEWHPNCLCDRKTAHPEVERPAAGKPGVMFRCGKAAGRELDGRTWDEVPSVGVPVREEVVG